MRPLYLFLFTLGAALLGFVVPVSGQSAVPEAGPGLYHLFIGTYTGEGSAGIYRSEFDSQSGSLSEPELAATLQHPSFQCTAGNSSFLWSVSESWEGAGQVAGYALDRYTGALNSTDTLSSLGLAPCYVAFHEPSGTLLTANYSSGHVAALPVGPKGKANGPGFVHAHSGNGPVASRQGEAHAHCIVVGPGEHYLYSCDLGADKIYVYTLQNQQLVVDREIKTRPGAGPRHLAFHPGGRFMAVVNELNGTIETYLPDADGCYARFHKVYSTLPETFAGFNKSADIHFTPDGSFLYASNRGHNSIAIYSVHPESYDLEPAGWQTKDCHTTRNFAIDPTGTFLLAANQDANQVVVFRINPQTGQLSDSGHRIGVSRPVCLTLIKKN
ncbi:MAG TPA: lactonase family protein [Prolixibacteraceae bacterium]|nr:lactonase family protein [Prolixibacteraceae bacterium]